MRFSKMALVASSGSLLFATACANVPADGPSTGAIASAANEGSVRIEPLTMAAAATWTHPFARPEIGAGGVSSRPLANRIEVGDRLNVAVYEALDEGVFATSGQRGSQFTDVLVEPDGAIRLPYAGAIPAAGRSADEVRQAIINNVRRFTVRPDATVMVASRNMGSVSVGGAVRTPGRWIVGQDVVTVLDAISMAGAPLEAPHGSTVIVRTANGTTTTSLAQIAFGPSTRLTGDTEIVVAATPARFQALGSVRMPGSKDITTAGLNLLDALSSVGGLDGARANPRGVFVFRKAAPDDADQRPLVYQLNMGDAGAFAIATAFPVLPNDTIYVTEAPVAQWTKILAAIQGTISVGASAATVDRLVRN
ncbi:MAG: hypothetical protein EON91_03330 [Brevundimonas sp.]|uniref:polysaccharide biosynthesis/export family protein n=1 Tax=Brevundimonas sp. TaxID=1871086 RepID=UPI00121B2DC3|nr:polysaccharide biosynthesis/export family protein [Brevundimonas sp.]RZJ18929.1 MAG: hypothetical protein EON91_03330 [Brevundimonas sp.]